MENSILSEIFNATPENIEKLLDSARTTSWRTFGKKIYFYTPTFLPYKSTNISYMPNPFPSISVTGNRCSLKCAHCNGKMLETMIPVESGNSLIELCRRIEKAGGVGCLISGGCRPDGSVPMENFVEAIKKIKSETNLTVVVHTGVLSDELAQQLANANIDAALMDIIGSNETIQEIYQLNAIVEDYEKSMKALNSAGIPFVPHVLVGLHYGKLRGELEALRTISNHNPVALIFIAFIPIRGTSMENIDPPDPIDIARVMVAARSLMPRIPHALGCARPTSDHRKKTDVLAVQAGMNAIAFPTDEAISTAKSIGLETRFSSMCCSQVYVDIAKIAGVT